MDVSAPGVSICSTVPGADGYYQCGWDGTSMATPHVSGLAALLASQGLNNSWVRYRIEATATDLGPAGKDAWYGYGRMNALRAVSW